MVNQLFRDKNDVTGAWSRRTKVELLQAIASLNLDGQGALYRSIKSKLRKRNGEVYAIAYSLARHGVFLEKGVGKETPIQKVGQTKRRARPWFNPTIRRNIDTLADELFFYYDQEISNNIFIR